MIKAIGLLGSILLFAGLIFSILIPVCLWISVIGLTLMGFYFYCIQGRHTSA